MNPRQFLKIGGMMAILVGVLGFFVLGPTVEKSVFGERLWFDRQENMAYILLGILAFAASSRLPAFYQRSFVILIGLLSVIVGLYSLVLGNTLFAAHLENPADTILHLLIGAVALYTVFGDKSLHKTA